MPDEYKKYDGKCNISGCVRGICAALMMWLYWYWCACIGVVLVYRD